MRSDEAVIANVKQVMRPREGARSVPSQVTVVFADGTKGTLDGDSVRDQVWADVLQSLQERQRPAFVKIDARSGKITLLLLPMEVRVIKISESDWGDLILELDPSHAIHWLRRSHPGFNQLRAILAEALRRRHSVLVTESTDSPEIVDVRPMS